MPRARAIKSSPFNHYNFIAPRYVTWRYTGWLGLRAASHYKRPAATNFAKLWRSRRRVAPQSWKRALISSVRDVQRRRRWRRRPPPRPFCSPLIASARRRDMKLSVLSRASSWPRALGVSRREAHEGCSDEVCELRNWYCRIWSSVLRAAIFFHRGYTHAAATAWRALRKNQSNFQIILRRAGERVRERRTRETPYLCGQEPRLKCNKSISVDFIFFPRFNLFPLFFLSLLFWNTVEARKRALPAATPGYTSLESGPLDSRYS